jgi:hypothetical protein
MNLINYHRLVLRLRTHGYTSWAFPHEHMLWSTFNDINIQNLGDERSSLSWLHVTLAESLRPGNGPPWRNLSRFAQALREISELCLKGGRAVAHAVSRRFPAAAGLVRAQVRPCAIWGGGQDGNGKGFLRVSSVSLAKHSTDCSTLIIIDHHLELVQQPNKWPQ